LLSFFVFYLCRHVHLVLELIEPRVFSELKWQQLPVGPARISVLNPDGIML